MHLNRTRILSALASLALVLGVCATAFAATGTVTGKVTAVPEKYLGDTVVFIKDVPGTYPPTTKNLDQKGMKFSPGILLITKGDTVKFLNHDTVAHNVYSSDFEGYNLGTFQPGEERSYTFQDTTGAYTQLCSIHPEMLGYIFVGQNPFSATVGATGSYTLKDVPAGTYKLSVWNPKLKSADQTITVTAGKPVTADFSLKR